MTYVQNEVTDEWLRLFEHFGDITMGLKKMLGININNEIDSEIFLPNKVLPTISVIAGMIVGIFFNFNQILLLCLVLFVILRLLTRLCKSKIDRYDMMVLYQFCLAIIFVLSSFIVIGLRHIL